MDVGMAPDHFEQLHGSFDICLEERESGKNAPVDVGLCSKMDDRVDLVLGAELIDEKEVIDIALDELVAGVFEKPFQIFRVCCVGQGIEIDDFSVKIR